MKLIRLSSHKDLASEIAGSADPAFRRMTPERRRAVLLSYLPDWVITVALAVIFFALDTVPGYKRDFSLQDTSLQHPYAVNERVPNSALYMIAILAPFILQGLLNLVTVQSWWDFHLSTLGLVLALATTGAFTQFSKITVGRPRPDIISRCMPVQGSMDPMWGLSNYTICSQTDNYILRDGFRSFPSGHSSLSFAGLGFLAFYTAGKLHLFDRKGHVLKAWIALTPIAAASLVAISRTMDYRHHWHDVLVGSLLGLALAYFSYRQYYPHLGSRHSHHPFPPRINRVDEGVDQHQDTSALPIHNEAEHT